MKDFILFNLPPPSPPNSPQARKGIFLAALADKNFKAGRLKIAIDNIIAALKAGVPEPFNSELKFFLLKNLELSFDNSPRETSSSSSGRSENRSNMIKCPKCNSMNKIGNKFCTQCGFNFSSKQEETKFEIGTLEDFENLPSNRRYQLLKDFLLYRKISENHPYSEEGKRAFSYASKADQMKEIGNEAAMIYYMIKALENGIPDPSNTKIRAYLLKLIEPHRSTDKDKPMGPRKMDLMLEKNKSENTRKRPQKTMEFIRCPKCNREISKGSMICPFCGADLVKS